MKKGNKGFTLIELLVVIAIIAILSTVVMAGLNSARSKSRDAKRLSDIKQIQSALELYYDTCGGYLPAVATALGDVSPFNAVTACSGAGKKLTDFISPIPTTPMPGGNAYTYCSVDPATGACHTGTAPTTSQTMYKITFNLENASGGLASGVRTAYASSTGVGIQ